MPGYNLTVSFRKCSIFFVKSLSDHALLVTDLTLDSASHMNGNYSFNIGEICRDLNTILIKGHFATG